MKASHVLMMILQLITVSTVTSWNAHAQNGTGRDGGDPDEIRFQTAAHRLIEIYKEISDLKKNNVEPFASMDLSAFSILENPRPLLWAIENTQVSGFPSGSPQLNVTLPDGKTLARKATNGNETDRTIYVDQEYCRNSSLNDPAFLSFVFHEYLGIINQDANYEISGPFTEILNKYLGQASKHQKLADLLGDLHQAALKRNRSMHDDKTRYQLLKNTSDYSDYFKMTDKTPISDRAQGITKLQMILANAQWDAGIPDEMIQKWHEENESIISDLKWIQADSAHNGGCKSIRKSNKEFCDQVDATLRKLQNRPAITSTPRQDYFRIMDQIDHYLNSSSDLATARKQAQAIQDYNKLLDEKVNTLSKSLQAIIRNGRNDCIKLNESTTRTNQCIFELNLNYMTVELPKHLAEFDQTAEHLYEITLQKIR